VVMGVGVGWVGAHFLGFAEECLEGSVVKSSRRWIERGWGNRLSWMAI
jgi:hypothetical protein